MQNYYFGMVWPRNTWILHYLICFSLFLQGACSVYGDVGAASNTPIPILKVGFLYSKTGSNSLIEKELARGIRLFELTHPKELRKIKVIKADNHGSLKGTLEQMKKFKDQEANFVVGLRSNEEALAASQFAEENEMLFVTPLAIYSKVALGKKNTFQLTTNEVLQAGALARFAVNDLKRKKVLVLVNHRSVFSQGFAESFKKGLKGFEGVLCEEHTYNGRDLNLENLKSRVLKFKPDMVFISDEISNSAILAKYIYRLDPLIPYLTGDPFSNETVMKTMLKEVPQMRVYYSSLWSEEVRTPENDKFKKLYLSRYPKEIPSQESALTYDALSILSEAFALTPDSPTLDRVRYYLEHTKFQTTQGEIDFSSGPTHSPVKDVYIKVSNIEKNKAVKTLRVKWKTRP